MDDLPEIVKATESNEADKVQKAIRSLRSEIDSIWNFYWEIADSAEFNEVGYLQGFLKNTVNSLPVFNLDNYKCPAEVARALLASAENYREVAALIRAQIRKLLDEIARSDLFATQHYNKSYLGTKPVRKRKQMRQRRKFQNDED